jgi:hypothetical protein
VYSRKGPDRTISELGKAVEEVACESFKNESQSGFLDLKEGDKEFFEKLGFSSMFQNK